MTAFGERRPSSTQFHILSFEGPDNYARAGGIASRITGLSQALADRGHETHLWFIGDPSLPGHQRHDSLALHRWCQWISRHHPGGVYDGEDGKCHDYAASLPPFLLDNELRPHLASGEHAVVLAEEWQTAPAVMHLDALLRKAGLRERVTLLWNANNTFGFERIDWPRLRAAATIVTVSRYMKHRMRAYGVDPVVIPNGLGPESFAPPDKDSVASLRRRFAQRLLLAKVARWDPDKRWLLAVDTVAELKRQGHRPLLVARGGMEPHGGEVLAWARRAGLKVGTGSTRSAGGRGLLDALDTMDEADVVVLDTHLDSEARSVLFRAADAVLANSDHEPFGLVGLEAMAVGGLACTGASGEDYAIDGQNALVLQQDTPHEFVALFGRVHQRPEHVRRLRRSAMSTARQYAWPQIVDRALLPRIGVGEGPDARETQPPRADVGATRSRQSPTHEPPGGADEVRIMPAGLGYPVPSGPHRMSLQRPQSIVRTAKWR